MSDLSPLPAAARPELVFGLVGGAGVRLDDLAAELKRSLGNFRYETIDIRLSDLLVNYCGWQQNANVGEYSRITHLQNMGNSFRRKLKDSSALARAGIAEIRKQRSSLSIRGNTSGCARAYIVRQLKHPEEVDLFRQVYGESFLLIAGHAPRDMRANDLAKNMARKDNRPGEDAKYKSDAHKVIQVDEKEDDEYGQNTRDTYPKADFFANLGINWGEHAVRRFVDLVFGHPFHTPLPEEYAMYQASVVALRSSDDNRQVGAAILDMIYDDDGQVKAADVIAVGMNEVPRGGGGFYWDGGSPDNRDQSLEARGEDRAEAIKISSLAELIGKMRKQLWLTENTMGNSDSDLDRSLLPHLGRTQFLDIGEFSRPVHAEMAALIDGARRGVPVNGRTMYVTTFPCHNCAKHIIAAGLKKVVYLEPYPKSRADNLYGEEISLESSDGKAESNKVVFSAFSGIAPRQYRQLFSMSERGAKKGCSLKEWDDGRRDLSPRYVGRNAAVAYTAAECQEMGNLPVEIYQ